MRHEVVQVDLDRRIQWHDRAETQVTTRHLISPDGKVHTITRQSRDAQGRPVHIVIVHQKR